MDKVNLMVEECCKSHPKIRLLIVIDITSTMLQAEYSDRGVTYLWKHTRRNLATLNRARQAHEIIHPILAFCLMIGYQL